MRLIALFIVFCLALSGVAPVDARSVNAFHDADAQPVQAPAFLSVRPAPGDPRSEAETSPSADGPEHLAQHTSPAPSGRRAATGKGARRLPALQARHSGHPARGPPLPC